jgi:hypothetical protein
MNSFITRSFAGGAVHASAGEAFRAHLSAVYALTQDSPYVFASPLGPFSIGGRSAFLPRFVFFGPHASDQSWRLAFLAGYSSDDLRPSHALLALVERLFREAEAGNGLHLAFFPVVDAGGVFLEAAGRGLGRAHWARSAEPEPRLLEKDCRLQGYHGFVRIETAPGGEDIATLSVRDTAIDALSPDLELISTDETGPIPVRFEARAGRNESGPLSVAEDLPFTPFELTLSLPSDWPDAIYQNAAGLLLQRFLWRYRAFQAYGQHL